MTKRHYFYCIKVVFDISNKDISSESIEAEYLNSKGYKDKFIFNKKSFAIHAYRSKIIPEGLILTNSSNSINKQILKGLLYYYSLAKKFPKIKTISIIRNKTNEHDYIYKINHSYIIQPIISKNINIFCFNKNIIKELFNESERGNFIE